MLVRLSANSFFGDALILKYCCCYYYDSVLLLLFIITIIIIVIYFIISEVLVRLHYPYRIGFLFHLFKYKLNAKMLNSKVNIADFAVVVVVAVTTMLWYQ